MVKIEEHELQMYCDLKSMTWDTQVWLVNTGLTLQSERLLYKWLAKACAYGTFCITTGWAKYVK